MTNPLDLVVVAQGLFGLAFLMVGTVLYRLRTRRRAFRGRGSGTIVALRPRDHADAPLSLAAVTAGTATIRFMTESGQEVLARSEISGGGSPSRPGDMIPVLYDPADPQRIMIEPKPGPGVLTAVWLLALGTVFEIVTLGTAAVAIVATKG
ncbi:MAG: DUF3592 domain-containing protein [Solirubrobacteraceae bacterium]